MGKHVRRDGRGSRWFRRPVTGALLAWAIAAPAGWCADRVRLIADGRERVVEPGAATVADALRAAAVTLGEQDEVTPSLGSPLRDGTTIRVVRIVTREVTEEQRVPAPTIVRPAGASAAPYHPTVTAPGTPGLVRNTYRLTQRDGVAAGKLLLRQEVVREPVPQIVTSRRTYGVAARGVYGGRRVFQMVATAYDPGPGSCPGTADGITCNGKRAGYGVAAVDPTVIPLGSKLYIEGYGYAIAADVGGAIKGNRIDLGYNSRSGALQWGRRTVTVYVLD
jgi:3D (Asp-Asp-Asp) domain-containing protein